MPKSEDQNPQDGNFAPFDGVYDLVDGAVAPDTVGRRLPALIEALRHHEPCFPIRIDVDDLAAALIGDAGADLRASDDEESFEAALRGFSREHLHELVRPGQAEEAGTILQAIADDASATRKRRGAAAAGVALCGGPPDDRGLRGRGVFDLVLRISLEELHAQQALRSRAGDDGGLDPDDLKEFWKTYPALRHHYEQRYRRDVQAVLDALEGDRVPQVVSVDLALRGAHRLLAAVGAQRDAGGDLDGDQARELLGTTFEDDFLDGGRELVVERWTAAGRKADEAGDTERATTCTQAVRLIGPGSPGGEMILFHAYMRAVLEGSFHVRDDAEAAAARAVFAGEDGLSVTGVLAFAQHLVSRGDADAARRALLAAVELWPEHDAVRVVAVQAAQEAEAAARKARQGPLYQEVGETFAESLGDTDV